LLFADNVNPWLLIVIKYINRVFNYQNKIFIHFYVFLKRSLRSFLYTIPNVSAEIPRRFDFKHIRDIQCDTPQDA